MSTQFMKIALFGTAFSLALTACQMEEYKENKPKNEQEQKAKEEPPKGD